MKDHVNFLDSLQAPLRIKQKLRQGIILLATTTMLLVAGHVSVLKHQVGRIRTDCRSLEDRVDLAKKMRAGLQALEKERQDLLGRKADIAGRLRDGPALGEAPRWSSLLVDLARQLPPRTWLERFAMESGSDGAAAGGRCTVRLSGRTFSQQDLLDFLSRLEQDPAWATVALTRSEKEGTDQGPPAGLHRFELALTPALVRRSAAP
ncbi:MAG: PilN domain-containing protein [bacterium]